MLTKNAPRPATMHAVPVMMRASAPRRVPTSTATASAASGGSRSRNGHVGRLGRDRRRGRVESTRQTDHRRTQRPASITSTGPRPDRADQQQESDHDCRRTRSWRSHRDAAAGVRRNRRHVGTQQPGRGVDQRADPAGERQHQKAEPHDVGVDARARRRDRPASLPATMRPS